MEKYTFGSSKPAICLSEILTEVQCRENRSIIKKMSTIYCNYNESIKHLNSIRDRKTYLNVMLLVRNEALSYVYDILMYSSVLNHESSEKLQKACSFLMSVIKISYRNALKGSHAYEK